MDFTEENPLSVSSVGAAVRNNDFVAVRRAIAKGRSVDLKDNRGWSPLHYAASKDYIDCIHELLYAGAEIDIKTHEGETPLYLACANNCYEAAVILLEAGCSVNLSNNESITPLHCVAKHGFDNLAILLMNKKANVNARDYDYYTPLLEAVRHNQASTICILLGHGKALQAISDSSRNLPIHHACLLGHTEILEILLKGCQYSSTAQRQLFGKNYLEKVVNWMNIDGYTPLMLAVQSRNLSNVKLLLKFGADANKGFCIKHGLTSLHLAAYYGDLPILKVILDATTKETIRKTCSGDSNKNLRSSLICNAILSKSQDCLEFLLDYGFESEVLNAKFLDTNPIGCLFRIRFLNTQPQFLQILLKSGYDPNCLHIDNYSNFTYFTATIEDLSLSNEQIEYVVHQLVDHGLNFSYQQRGTCHFMASCIKGLRFKLIPYLLQKFHVTEPYLLLDYILRSQNRHDSCQRPMSTLITFLSHYVDPSGVSHTFRIPAITSPEREPLINLSHSLTFPSLKGMARSAIRKHLHSACETNPHQFKVRLNSLDLPASLISYLNYEEMVTFYESLEKNHTTQMEENVSTLYESIGLSE
ncbi:ankyrin repeat and SOCS box protein 3-like [Nilaparvata lugens]|uniref:ankyrin repeat and SOCS box protein 3-like n=1 Tax=Nilaparvata lugens TaxID=108931 RepID=UPI00193DBAC8|nr:ankyrin repeat and SOCS box protein 3-like [Nilaparvata lugens]XP_022197656.2 ankyrin repeat and SOCS box protein 3-like [Nilaparvata lugens]